MSNPSGIQSNAHGFTLDQFRSLAADNSKGDLTLKAGGLQVAKRKFLGLSLITGPGPGPGRQKALAAFKDSLRANYGSELADLTLAKMKLNGAHKLKANQVRMLDYHLGNARQQLESRYLKPAQFDSSVARLASNVNLKIWASELKAIKNPERKQQLLNQGITDVYNHYESKLGKNGKLADRATVLESPRWKEFSQFVSEQFKTPVVRPNFTAEEMGVRAQEASLMHAQVWQLDDVIKNEGKSWVDNGRTGSIQLLMASAMLDTMNSMWSDHKDVENTDWKVDCQSEKNSQWKVTSKTHEDKDSNYGSKVEVNSARGVSLDTAEFKGVVKPVVKAEVEGKASIEVDGNLAEVNASATATAQVGIKVEKEGHLGSEVTYKATHEHGAIAEAKVSVKGGSTLFKSGALAGSTITSPDEFDYKFGNASASGFTTAVEAKVEAKAGVYVKDSASLDVGNYLNLEASAEGFVGLKGEAKATAGITGLKVGSPAGMKAEAKASAFAGVEGTAKFMAQFFKTEFIGHALKVHVEAKGMAGVGGSASAKAEFTTENVEVGASASGAVGVGGGAGFGTAVNPLAMLACGNAALASAFSRFDRELSNIFDDKALKQQNTLLLKELNKKVASHFAGYEKEVDSALNGDIRFRDELRTVSADAGLDKLGKLDQTGLQSKLLAMSEQELDQQNTEKVDNPKLDRRDHVFKFMDQDQLNDLANTAVSSV